MWIHSAIMTIFLPYFFTISSTVQMLVNFARPEATILFYSTPHASGTQTPIRLAELNYITYPKTIGCIERYPLDASHENLYTIKKINQQIYLRYLIYPKALYNNIKLCKWKKTIYLIEKNNKYSEITV